KPLGNRGQPAARLLPAAVRLHLRNRRKIDRPHQDFGRMQATERVPDALVQPRIVMRGGLATHAADEADDFHRIPYSAAVSIRPEARREHSAMTAEARAIGLVR